MPDFHALGPTCVAGLQWGDEGKGKIVDTLLEHFDVVVRYSGGANAGHTVVVGDEKFALHQLPCGVLREGVISVIAGGAVIDPAVLLGEIASLRRRGIDCSEDLKISNRAHLVFPYHRRQDQLAERAAQDGAKLGTTARGIGPCYSDKASRHFGIRVCDLYRPDRFRQRLARVVAHKNAYFAALYDARDAFDADAMADEYLAFAEQLKPRVCDTSELLNRLIAEGRAVLFEGAQGALLDVDGGTYPFVTSANTGPGSIAGGAGIAPALVRATLGIVKAYTTRVGEGPFPTELNNGVGDRIRELGREYGTTTGRPRRCGWFDAVAAGYSARCGGATHLGVMHLDTLSGFDSLEICVAYRSGDETLNAFPADPYLLEEVTPVYETLPGWSEELGDCRRLEDLPPNARAYVERVNELLGTQLSVIGVGPERAQVIFT